MFLYLIILYPARPKVAKLKLANNLCKPGLSI